MENEIRVYPKFHTKMGRDYNEYSTRLVHIERIKDSNHIDVYLGKLTVKIPVTIKDTESVFKSRCINMMLLARGDEQRKIFTRIHKSQLQDILDRLIREDINKVLSPSQIELLDKPLRYDS